MCLLPPRSRASSLKMSRLSTLSLQPPPLLILASQIISHLSSPSSAPDEFLYPSSFIPSVGSQSSVRPSSPRLPEPEPVPVPVYPSPPASSEILPASVLALLPTRPSAVLVLSRSKIHSYPFAEVPRCWFRFFVDSSALIAARRVGQHFNGIRKLGLEPRKLHRAPEDGEGREEVDIGENEDDMDQDQDGKEDWISSVVRLLDMAFLMAGWVGREDVIATLLHELEAHLQAGVTTNVGEPDTIAKGDLQRPEKRPKLAHDDEGQAQTRHRIPSSLYDDSFPVTLDDRPPQINFPVIRYAELSLYAFEQHLHRGDGRAPGPMVIMDGMDGWPALSGNRAWSRVPYLMSRTMGGRRLVPVEVGRSYTEEGWGQKIVTFKEFLEGLLVRKDKHDIGYLAQHDLLSQIPALRQDVYIPDYCFTSAPPHSSKSPGKTMPKLKDPLLNTWFGPAGTVSPLHTDPYHNILCQVVGKKYIRLYSPEESAKLYPMGVEGDGIDMSNTSDVDLEGEEIERDKKFPLFRDAAYVETILVAGECFYIPEGWWHYVRSLTVSISVSFWWN
jgi:hypothetical protein